MGWQHSIIRKDPKWHAFMTENFLLSWDHIKAKKYWTILTSAFSQIDMMHALFNLANIYYIGRFLAAIPSLRLADLAVLSFGAAIAGSLGWLASNRARRPGQKTYALGSSGMVMGLLTATACLAPSIIVSLFGILPMPIGLLTVGYLFYDGYYLDSPTSTVAHGGHLGGMAFGLAFYVLRLRRLGSVVSRNRWVR